jgi:plasmid stabilization system protein ParE
MRPDIAKQKIQAIRSGIGTLNEMPERFAPIDEKPWGDEGIRKMVLSPYLVYYWINEKLNKVQIIAVIHEKQDQAARLEMLSSSDTYEGPFII